MRALISFRDNTLLNSLKIMMFKKKDLFVGIQFDQKLVHDLSVAEAKTLSKADDLMFNLLRRVRLSG